MDNEVSCDYFDKEVSCDYFDKLFTSRCNSTLHHVYENVFLKPQNMHFFPCPLILC
jgi:hypothetical protein